MLTSINPNHVETIKALALTGAGIKSISPMGCRSLSFSIIAKTKLRISETTIKRLFGFALSKFNPSFFTLQALSTYCGYETWDAFCIAHPFEVLPSIEHSMGWKKLRQRADEISKFTMQVLKNKSGVPYQQTTSRVFFTDFMQAFAESGQSCGLITAPAGYGKTIALCHWVEENEEIFTRDDAVLFYSGSAMMTALHSGKSMEDWMQLLLGFHSIADFEAITMGRGKGKFYLVLDGMDEHLFRKSQFNLILDQIVHLIAFYQDFSWFKLIMTMRTTTWINYRQELTAGNLTWFTGCSTNDTYSNLPPLNFQELNELDNSLTNDIKQKLTVDQAAYFRNPLYFQYYYQHYQGIVPLSKADRSTIYDLHSQFVFQKVYQGNQASDKVLLIRQIAEMIDLEDKDLQIDKIKVTALIKQYESAYQELLAGGILQQLNQSLGHLFRITVRFCESEILFQTLARIIMIKNGERFNAALVRRINLIFKKSEQRVSVLKWSVFQALKAGQRDNFQHISKLRASIEEKSEIMLFLDYVQVRIGMDTQ